MANSYSYRTPETTLNPDGTPNGLAGYVKYTLTTTPIKLVDDIAGIITLAELNCSGGAMIQVEATGLTDENLAVRYRQDATLVSSTDGFILGNYDSLEVANTVELRNISFVSIDAGATVILHIQLFKGI